MRFSVPRPAAIVFLSLATGCAGMSAHVEASQPGDVHTGSRSVATLAPSLPTTSTDATPPSTTGPHEADPQAESVPIPSSELVRGRATVTVHAPIEKVREAVLGFATYAEFMPHYEKCKLLGRTATGAREVYMEIEALHGAVHMWAQIQLPKPTIVEGVETYETQFEKGNVDDFKAIWRIKKIDDQSSELSLEVFLKPTIRLPVQLLNNENLKGAVKGVVAMKRRAQGEQTVEED